MTPMTYLLELDALDSETASFTAEGTKARLTISRAVWEGEGRLSKLAVPIQVAQ
jgi:hypothetical protein